MDDESKSVIDALLGKPKAKEPPRPSGAGHWSAPPRGETWAEKIVRERREREASEARAAMSAASTKSAFSERSSAINTHEEIAILSVNQAKACIVLRAPITVEISQEITKISKESERKWNDRDNVWELHPSILPKLKPLLKTFYKDVQVLGVQKQIPTTKFDQLIARLDKEDRDKVYKMLALKYHPDRGGDKDIMTLINLVFKGQ